MTQSSVFLLGNALKNDDSVFISDFGSFKPVKCATRKVRNSRTGQEIQIPEFTATKFIAGKTLKENL